MTDTSAVPRDPTLPTLQEVKGAFEAFSFVWNKVPRSVRPEKDANQRMVLVRDLLLRVIAFLEVERRTALATAATDGLASDEDEGEEDRESPLRIVMRLVRTLDRDQWDQVEILMNMRWKLSNEGFLELIDEALETHCKDCGVELDDDDDHDDCPASKDSVSEPPGDVDSAAVVEPATS